MEDVRENDEIFSAAIEGAWFAIEKSAVERLAPPSAAPKPLHTPLYSRIQGVFLVTTSAVRPKY
jgi:hypothetical protein